MPCIAKTLQSRNAFTMKNVIRREDAANLGADDYITIYKQILTAILPPSMISGEGFLREPDGDGETITLFPPAVRRQSLLSKLLSTLTGGARVEQNGSAKFEGRLVCKILRLLFEDVKDTLPLNERDAVIAIMSKAFADYQQHDTIDISGARRAGSLHHETFHDIQGYLLDYHTAVYKALQDQVNDEREAIEGWYRDPATHGWRTPDDYQLTHLFPSTYYDSPLIYCSAMGIVQASIYGYTQTRLSDTARILCATLAMECGRAEAIPVLLAACAEGDLLSRGILGRVFGAAGLNPNFYDTMPKFL